MKYFLGFVLLLFVGAAGWRIGESLSSDATGMAVGMLLGMMSGIPTALLVLASSRQREQSVQPSQPSALLPPIIVIEPPEHASFYDVPVGTKVSELQRKLPGCHVVRYGQRVAVWEKG